MSAASWTSPADLRGRVQKLWDRGELLGCLVTGAGGFPKRFALKGPTSNELSERFEAVRAWIGALSAMRYMRLEMREVRHRVLGTNSVPAAVWVDSLQDALAMLGKAREAQRFATLVDETARRQPALLDWLGRRALRALALEPVWGRLLDVVDWLQAHPRSGIYLRQVDIPGVHTKLIEAHRGVLRELLDLALPPSAIDASATGAAQFARRYGFLDKPLRIRFRILDPQRSILPGPGITDMALDAASFARLNPDVSRVFITENEINFLALPPLADSMVLFGAGYGFDNLREAGWLASKQILYWGDIDTHGFAILDQLRGLFAHVDSFLMDRATLMAFAPLWGEEDRPTNRDLARLGPEESALYDDLRDNRIRARLRLEQERIGFGWVESALRTLGRSADSVLVTVQK